MPPTDEIKITEFRPSLSGINPKPAADIYPVNPSTILQQSKRLLDPPVFISK